MATRQRIGRDRWEQLVLEQPGSGQSITAFCRTKGVSQNSFYLWRRKLANEPKPSQNCSPFISVEHELPEDERHCSQDGQVMPRIRWEESRKTPVPSESGNPRRNICGKIHNPIPANLNLYRASSVPYTMDNVPLN